MVLKLENKASYRVIGVYNNGYDNENNEYILLVNDIIKSPENEE